MSKVIFCTVNTSSRADYIVERLKAAGIASKDISVLLPDTSTSERLAVDNESKAPEGATAGVSTGALLGGGLGWLAGIGALAIPGLGPLIAAGPIMAALTGAALGGAVGGVSGALIGMGIPEYEAKLFEGKLKAGRALISVHADDNNELDHVRKLFELEGAEDISTSSGPVAAAR